MGKIKKYNELTTAGKYRRRQKVARYMAYPMWPLSPGKEKDINWENILKETVDTAFFFNCLVDIKSIFERNLRWNNKENWVVVLTNSKSWISPDHKLSKKAIAIFDVSSSINWDRLYILEKRDYKKIIEDHTGLKED